MHEALSSHLEARDVFVAVREQLVCMRPDATSLACGLKLLSSHLEARDVFVAVGEQRQRLLLEFVGVYEVLGLVCLLLDVAFHLPLPLYLAVEICSRRLEA